MAQRPDEESQHKNGSMKPWFFSGSSGAELIVARASLPTKTPDRFKQANINRKSVLQKRG
ncbi:hypothetical protein [Xenorhabdus griffiniae]|uniref:hypothetical protein n=1 Tax=Xenorhabdus griffiniae TaxID=351672 RepID=UPI00235A45C7|nr:hypothetical protein [Xenorhabdus griffiniae]